MSSTTLHSAMQECHKDPSCNAFYKVCSYERYRKCNDTAYEEDSECGLVGNKSFLYIKGISNYYHYNRLLYIDYN